MPEAALPDLVPALPEILLALGAMAMLMFGVFRAGDARNAVNATALVLLVLAAVLVVAVPGETRMTFGGAFILDAFARVLKMLVLIGSFVAIVMSIGYFGGEKDNTRFELPVLIVLATVGMMMMLSANDLIALYMGLELQSLALYVVAAIQRESTRATEAGLKYFVLGALASGMLLYGASLIYGFTGTVDFTGIADSVAKSGASVGLVFGLVFLLAGLAFKVSAVPFHMWTPDVYEGAPTPITAFFATAPKIAAMGIFVRAMIAAFPAVTAEWQQVVTFIAIASMALGAFAAIGQTNIKRLMAYSSIGHMGYALVGLAAGTQAGVKGVVLYLAIYIAMNAGTFAIILAMRRREGMVEDIYELAGLARRQPVLAALMAVMMFSLAGIPPLAGFAAKFYVFLAAIEAQLYWLAVIGVLASVVGAFYYLRIVKLMYFDEPAEAFEPMPRQLRVVLALSSIVVLFFFIVPGPLIAAAESAAKSLF